MENQILDVIHRHASVRHYRPDPLPAETIETIIAASQRASSSSNFQAYSVIAVTDLIKREKLAVLCGNQQHVASAPVFLAFCADLARLERVCELRGQAQSSDHLESFLIAAVDAAIAAQTAALAAESLGLGICYIGSIRNNSQGVIDLLELPSLVFPITGMTVGWPAFEHKSRPRLPMRTVLHREKYDTTGLDADLYRYDRAMIDTGIYQGRQIPVPGKPDEIEEYGWLEHTARRVAKPARVEMRAIIEKQGFGLK